jgi:hypothetical protein
LDEIQRTQRADQRVASRVARQAALRERAQARARRHAIVGVGLLAALLLVTALLVSVAGERYPGTPGEVTASPTAPPPPTLTPTPVTLWRGDVMDDDEPVHRFTEVTTRCAGDAMTATARVANAKGEPVGYAGVWLTLIGHDGRQLGRSLAVVPPMTPDAVMEVTFHDLPCRGPNVVDRLAAEMEFCNDPPATT